MEILLVWQTLISGFARLTAPLLIVAVSLNKVSFATILAVIKTNDGYWIAADSKRQAGDLPADLACKIHETPVGVIAKASATQGFTKEGVDYSLDTRIADIARRSHSSAEFRQELRSVFEEDIWNQLSYMLGKPYPSKEQIRQSHFVNPLPASVTSDQFRQVILLSKEGNSITLRQLMVSPQSKPLSSGGFSYFVDILDWPEIDEKSIRSEDVKHPSLRQFAVPVDIEEDDAYIRLHPELILRKLLQRGTELHPSDVGPPFSIAHVYLSVRNVPTMKMSWLSKGKCPSWNIRTYNLDYMKRNDYRAP